MLRSCRAAACASRRRPALALSVTRKPSTIDNPGNTDRTLSPRTHRRHRTPARARVPRPAVAGITEKSPTRTRVRRQPPLPL